MLARSRLLPLAALAALAGCASTPKKPAEDILWPPPPEIARIKFVRAFANASQMSSGGFRTAFRLFVPESPDAQVQQPTGLALSTDDRYLYITCSSVSRVLRADVERGELDLFATEEGKRPASPFGVAVDAEDRVYVGDMGRNEILVYGADGKLARRITSERIDKPTGLAIDRRRQLLYVVSGVHAKGKDHRVEVFSLAGEHVRTIGTRGSTPGAFNFPTHVAVGPDGALHVVDMLNFRVQVFDPDGQLLGMFGAIGRGQPGTFDKAKGVALDTFGNIYVTDSSSGSVQIFNPQHRVLMGFSGRAELPGFMLLPNAITISSKNHIYVADFAAGAVHEFQLVNTTAKDGLEPPPPPAAAAGTSSPEGGAEQGESPPR